MDGSRFDRLTRQFGGRTTRRTAMGGTLAAFALGALEQVAAGQGTPESGAAGTAKLGEKPVFMFVQTASGGRGEVNPGAGTPVIDGTPTPAGGASLLLTLEGHAGVTVYFSDRRDRIVGAAPTDDFLKGLGFSRDNPPNAALVAEFASGQGVVVLQLIEPHYDAETGTLVYGAEFMEGYQGGNLEPVLADEATAKLPAEFGPGALFIDDCPDITGCYRASGFSDVRVGPIPGGPYGRCWSWTKPFMSCEPCHETWEYLNDLCNSTYACNNYCWAGPQGGWLS